MKGMLDPIYEEQVIGHAVVRQTFKASGVGTIAGSYVLDGKFQRGCKARITRDGEQIFDGPLASLKRFKDDVKEVASGYECGLVFEKFNDLQEDDMIEAYAMVEMCIRDSVSPFRTRRMLSYRSFVRQSATPCMRSGTAERKIS